MSAERSKIWEASKAALTGIAIIAVALVAADLTLFNLGASLTSGV